MSAIAETFAHGPSGYTNHGCRCDECRTGHTRRVAQRRAERAREIRANPDLAAHGTASTYQNWGCRCSPCTEASSEAYRAYLRRRREVTR